MVGFECEVLGHEQWKFTVAAQFASLLPGQPVFDVPGLEP